MFHRDDLRIPSLGVCHRESPIHQLLRSKDGEINFVQEDERVVWDPRTSFFKSYEGKREEFPTLELAGPRSKIYFNPSEIRAAIVSCGGLCPGINDVIRGLVMMLHYRYGVKSIDGIRYGYQGLIEQYHHPVLELTPDFVSDIHKQGGSILGSSRGPQDIGKMADFLVKRKIRILFTIGGDGTLRAALEVAREIESRKLDIAVVGIPKTVDNDILYIDESFGFETAFSAAETAITSAHDEAKGVPNGIGLVKLMGRNSGFIASYAALAMNDVNIVLIPEVPFELEGENGLLVYLKRRLEERHHAVIVVAEGAGQNLISGESSEKDESGNAKFKDVGLFLKDQINDYFKKINAPVSIKYIDPSYMIRSVPANPQDSVYCLQLAESAVHAAMCGKTKMVVGRRHNHYIHLPMELIASGRRTVDPKSDLWRSVVEATGQPFAFQNVAYHG